MSLTVDRTQESSNLALEAQAALGEGDTDRARELFTAAGDKLAKDVRNATKRPEKDRLRFLAASQYYQGGLYERARDMCRKIEERQLPDKVRHLFPDFRRDVNDRASPGYADGVRNRLRTLWEAHRVREIIHLLSEHPYVLSRGDLAFLRAVCCEALRDYRAAALFFADALRWDPDDADVMCHSAATPIMMVHEGHLAEAEGYITHQLELLPHPLTHAAASLLRFFQAKESRRDAEERRDLLNLQVSHCDSAWAGFMDLSAGHKQSPGTKVWMVLCLECGAFGADATGDRDKAIEYCSRAVELAPSKPGPYTVRGMLTYPDRQALDDFQLADRLREINYIPYYYLAHSALTRKEYRDAREWCEKALARSPSVKVRAQLLEWLAMSRAEVTEWFDVDAIRALFKQAKELDPNNARIERNSSTFEEGIRASTGPTVGGHWLAEISSPLPDVWSQREQIATGGTPIQTHAARVYEILQLAA